MKSTTVIIYCLVSLLCSAQDQQRLPAGSLKDIQWDNYSTSFTEPENSNKPVIVTAIPYNGIYSNFSDINNGIELVFDSLLSGRRSDFSNLGRKLYTYDSSDVYFLAPGIYRDNAKLFEYRILLNGKTTFRPWQNITQFQDSNFVLNNFKKGMAFLGGYKTTWNNYLLLELKRKNADSLIAAAVVYWKPVKPVLLNIYTTDELNSFLARLKNPYDRSVTKSENNKWGLLYKPGELDALSGLPKKLRLNASQDNIIFLIEGDIYKKEALEYRLLRGKDVVVNWKPNDFDNNFIWLKKLTPGDYLLEMRYRSQRHNISSYSFYIKPAWYQTVVFKTGVIVFTIIMLGLITGLWRQKQKTIRERVKTEKFSRELKVLRSQLNPHFVFNALSSIQGLVNKGELDAANHYLTEFSSLLRSTLKNNESEFLPLAIEIKILETYIKLEQLRFHFQYTITVGESIPVNDVEIPSLLVQPLVENAIKHAAGPKYENGLLDLRFSANGRDLVIDVIDNGNGFPVVEKSSGYGLRLVKERISLLNSTSKIRGISLSINSPANESTIVHLTFKNWL